MNRDERNVQFALEDACAVMQDALDTYAAGLCEEHRTKLDTGMGLFTEVLGALRADPENPDHA